ncbi:MAG: trypsin-like peptidase domain-containing protein [Fimbriimonadaceae bacterium]|nr:trypsin-like peptidase domain-containing protein [Fimbriimonadaceae bacterium]
MSIWKRVIARPGVLIGCGVVIGGIAMASVLNWRVGVPSVFAGGNELKPSPVASISTESMAALRELDKSFSSLVEFVAPSTVSIRGENSGKNTNGMRMGPMSGEGSGVIFRSDGWIVTNDHVVADFDKVTVVLNDGREFAGKVIRAKDHQNDIAVVKIEAKDLPAARFADSSQVKAGQYSIAIGAPFGLENSVTIGHISALGRASAVQDRGYSNMIQTDAAINPGNSGGALVNIEGEVIGINTSIISGGTSPFGGSGGNVGIGFAIPSNQARLIAEMLIEKGKVVRGYLGLVPEDLKKFEKADLKVDSGAIVRSVQSDGPAAAAGVKANDVIVRVGSMPVRDQQDVRNAMLTNAPGTAVEIEVIRGGERKVLKATVKEFPKELVASQPMPNADGGQDSPFKFFDRGDGNGFELNPKDLEKLKDQMGKGSDGAQSGKVRLGVGIEQITPELQKQFNIPASEKGVVIKNIEPGSIAEKAGYQIGDVIQEFDGNAVNTPEDLISALGSTKWGDSKSIKITRFSANGRSTIQAPVTFK